MIHLQHHISISISMFIPRASFLLQVGELAVIISLQTKKSTHQRLLRIHPRRLPKHNRRSDLRPLLPLNSHLMHWQHLPRQRRRQRKSMLAHSIYKVNQYQKQNSSRTPHSLPSKPPNNKLPNNQTPQNKTKQRKTTKTKEKN